MRRHQVLRALMTVATAILALALAIPIGCTPLRRSTQATDSFVIEQVSPPTYGDGSGGDLAITADEKDSGIAPDAPQSTSVGRAGSESAPLAQEQLVIRTGSMRLRVKDIDKAIERIRSATATFGGTIEDLQVSTETEQPVYRMPASGESADVAPLGAYVTIRVPSDRLEEFTKRVSSFGVVIRQASSQSDVTQQHIDLTARLKNLRAEESRLREFLKAAKDVKEMLLVETELSRVRGEIESLQGQLDYLDRQIAYATLSIELVKPAPVVRPSGTDWGFSEAITNGIQGAAGAVLGIITVAITVMPFALIALAIYLLVRVVLRRRRREHAATTPDVADEADQTATELYSGDDSHGGTA